MTAQNDTNILICRDAPYYIVWAAGRLAQTLKKDSLICGKKDAFSERRIDFGDIIPKALLTVALISPSTSNYKYSKI